MIKVLMINKLFHPVVGGIEITITQLCENLAKNPDFKISILASNEKSFSKTKSYVWKNANIHKLFSFGILFSTPISLQFPFALKKLMKENDVFHFHVPNPLGDFSFYLNKIPSNKKVIVTVHADVAQTQKKLFAPAYNFILKKLLDRADVITTSAPQNVVSFSILKKYQHKCVVVPLAYDERHIGKVENEKKQVFIQQFQLSETKKTVLFVGRLAYYKGLSFLIDAIKLIDHVQLLVVGDGKLKKKLQQQVSELQLADRVLFTGKLPDALLVTAYSIADVFVLPSIKQAETFGIVQAEAMAFGLPIINTNLNTGVNFVSINNETGLTVAPSDSTALQQAIIKILGDKTLSSTFSKNALKKSELFSPSKMANEFKNLYTQH